MALIFLYLSGFIVALFARLTEGLYVGNLNIPLSVKPPALASGNAVVLVPNFRIHILITCVVDVCARAAGDDTSKAEAKHCSSRDYEYCYHDEFIKKIV